MSKHTSGKWVVGDEAEGLWVYADPNQNVICDVVGRNDPHIMTGEDYANARLIAAAPELLKAVQKILEEPYGCTLCDSGIPRNAIKGHQPDCPFELARLAAEKAVEN